MIRGISNKARENARTLVDAMIDLSGYDIQTTDKHAAVREICAREMHCNWTFDTFKDWCNGLPSAFDSAEFLYNGTPCAWLARIYESTDAETDAFEKRTPRDIAEDRCIRWAFKVLDND